MAVMLHLCSWCIWAKARLSDRRDTYATSDTRLLYEEQACLKLASMRSPVSLTTEACRASKSAHRLAALAWLLLRKRLKGAPSTSRAISATVADSCLTVCNYTQRPLSQQRCAQASYLNTSAWIREQCEELRHSDAQEYCMAMGLEVRSLV